MRGRILHSDTTAPTHANMFHNIALTLAVVVASQLCMATPVPEPYGHRTNIRIHVPYQVHTLHHHHIEKVPIIKTVPIIKEVPVFKEVPVYKALPVVHTLPVPVLNTVHVEKPVFVPLPVKEHYSFSDWH